MIICTMCGTFFKDTDAPHTHSVFLYVISDPVRSGFYEVPVEIFLHFMHFSYQHAVQPRCIWVRVHVRACMCVCGCVRFYAHLG